MCPKNTCISHQFGCVVFVYYFKFMVKSNGKYIIDYESLLNYALLYCPPKIYTCQFINLHMNGALRHPVALFTIQQKTTVHPPGLCTTSSSSCVSASNYTKFMLYRLNPLHSSGTRSRTIKCIFIIPFSAQHITSTLIYMTHTHTHTYHAAEL